MTTYLSLEQRQVLTDPEILFSIPLLFVREFFELQSTKNPVALLHPLNAWRLQRRSLRPDRPLSTPVAGIPLSAGREVRFALRFARNGATGCQESVLACHILQFEMLLTNINWKCDRHFQLLIFSLLIFNKYTVCSLPHGRGGGK